METSLFRKEVLQKKHKHLGHVSINTPLPFVYATFASVLIIFTLLGFLCFANFTEKWQVTGFINAAEGVTQAYVQFPGIIKEVSVRAGQRVKKGQALFVVDINNHRENAEQITQSLQRRKQLIKKEILQKQSYLQQLKPLLTRKYIATTFYQSKRDEILSLKSQLHELNLELLRDKQTQVAVVKSPVNGTVSNIMAFMGQQVIPNKPLLSILPTHPTYIAQLYIPVQKIGFINPKDKITLHYDAYPYQRFGSGEGVIQSIGQTILTDRDEDKPITIKKPYYKALATIHHPSLLIYGKQRFIQQGMTFTAVILGSQKKIWQWLLDPLYSIKGTA